MNEKEKKAIEELSKKAIICNYEERDYPNMICFKKDMIIALNLIEKLQKENEELGISNKYTIHLTDKQYNVVIENAQNDINQKWIQKVKDKIEEILKNKEYRIVFEGNTEFPDDATIINAQKYIKLEKMQELIEERGRIKCVNIVNC